MVNSTLLLGRKTNQSLAHDLHPFSATYNRKLDLVKDELESGFQ